MSLYIEGNRVSTKSPEESDRVVFSFEQLALLLLRLPEDASRYDVLDQPAFKEMSPSEQAVVYGYLSTMCSYIRALVYEDTNPAAGDDASSNRYLRSETAAEQARLFDEIAKLKTILG